MKKNRGGRPAGVVPEMDPPVVIVQPASRCPKCQGIRRSDYIPGSKIEQVFAGQLPDGRNYTKIIRRRCRCLDCGQMRIDKEFV